MSKDIPATYISAVREAKGAIVPFAALEATLMEAGKATYEEQLGYSIVHIKADGKAARNLKETAFIAMPHVLARGGPAGKEVAATMKKAGFIADGLCKNRPTVEARQAEAARLAGKLWEMFAPKPPKAKAAPKTVAPKATPKPEEVPAQPAE